MVICLIPSRASSACYLCMKYDGGFHCTLVSGSCGDYDASLQGSSNRQCVAAMRSRIPKENTIFQEGNIAYAFHDGKKIYLASDAFVAFEKEMSEKYNKADLKEVKIQENINAEYSSFFKKDNHIISSKRLAQIVKETGFKLQKVNSTPTPSNDALKKKKVMLK